MKIGLGIKGHASVVYVMVRILNRDFMYVVEENP